MTDNTNLHENSNNRCSVIKCYKQDLPAMRFVGKCYKNNDRVNGFFGHCWGQWFSEGYFEPLEKLITDDFSSVYAEAGDYVALMKCKEGASEDYFEYWIGMFLPADCEVPEGYGYIDIKHTAAAICWFKGPEMELYANEDDCFRMFEEKKLKYSSEQDGGFYSFERYSCPRFTEPDDDNNVILDFGIFI